MKSEKSTRRTKVWPVYIALVILAFFALIFVIEFAGLSRGSGGVPDDELTAETYMDIVVPLLADANPERAPDLLQRYGCNACHSGESAGRFGPDFANVHDVAAERRPPLTAAAYVYEAIVHPGVFVVESYVDSMPRVYDEQIPEAELGDIIAYLLREPESE